MIFITAGTVHFPFERLAEVVNDIASVVKEEQIIFQHGQTKIKKKRNNVIYFNFLKYDEFSSYIQDARLVISQGGPATIYQTLYLGKQPWVFPRSSQFGEHVNDHQVLFCEYMKQKGLVKYLDLNLCLRVGSPKINLNKENSNKRKSIALQLTKIINQS